MATAQTIIEAALRNIGALALEEAMPASQALDGLRALNNMISLWNTESLMVYSVNPEVFPVVPNQQSYTMGPGGDFDTERPVLIEEAYMRDSMGNDFKVGIVDYEAYSAIITKQTSSSLPTAMYDNQDFPLKTLTFWPIASDSSYSFVLWVWKQIMSFTSLTTTVVLPPGYQAALEYNLSVWLAPRYGRAVSNDLKELAVQTKGQIKRINYGVKALTFDSALTPNGKIFNWYIGW